MTITLFTVILPLSCLMVASLHVANLATRRQQQLYLRLHRLSALEKRCASSRDTIAAVEALDEHPDLMRSLYLSLKNDLLRLKELDPERAELDAEIRQATARLTAQTAEASQSRMDKATSLGSIREVAVAGGFINEALTILQRLRRFNKISSSEFETAKQRLRYLSAVVSVNSSIRMAEIALEHRDNIKALSCYRRAENILQLSAITGREKTDKLAWINARKDELYAAAADEKGLLLLAADA